MSGRRTPAGGGFWSRRCRGDEGAVLVEAAMVLPVLATLLLGAFEFGMGWRQNSYQSASLASGIRQLATTGSNRPADLFALQSFLAGMTPTRNMAVERVVIFKSTATGAPTNAGCLTMSPVSGAAGTGVNGQCNVYGPDQLANLNATYFGVDTDGNCSGKADQYWCPLTRKSAQSDPPDIVGMYVVSTYTTYTRIIGSAITMSDRASMQIEPRVN